MLCLLGAKIKFFILRKISCVIYLNISLLSFFTYVLRLGRKEVGVRKVERFPSLAYKASLFQAPTSDTGSKRKP